MLCVAKNNNEYVEVTPVKVVKDNSLLNVIKGMNSYQTYNYPFELTADMWDENSRNINAYKYQYNYNITKVTIPNYITSMNNYAFAYCIRLTSVIIGNGLTSIGYAVFMSCDRLTSVTIGNSVKRIANDAFTACSNLSVVDFRNSTTIPTVQTYSFSGTPTSCKFIIPDELYDEWITATNWTSLYAKGYQFIKASEYTEA